MRALNTLTRIASPLMGAARAAAPSSPVSKEVIGEITTPEKLPSPSPLKTLQQSNLVQQGVLANIPRRQQISPFILSRTDRPAPAAWSAFQQARLYSHKSINDKLSFQSEKLGCKVHLINGDHCEMTSAQLQQAGEKAESLLARFAECARTNNVAGAAQLLSTTFIAMPTLHHELHHGAKELPGTTRSMGEYLTKDFFHKKPNLQADPEYGVVVVGLSPTLANATVFWKLGEAKVRQSWCIDLNGEEEKATVNNLHSSISPEPGKVN
jgi:hypothetical protein